MTAVITLINLSNYHSLGYLRSSTQALTIDLRVCVYRKGISSSYHGSTASSWRFYPRWIAVHTQAAPISWGITIITTPAIVVYLRYYYCSDQQADAMTLMTLHQIKVHHLHHNHPHRVSRSSNSLSNQWCTAISCVTIPSHFRFSSNSVYHRLQSLGDTCSVPAMQWTATCDLTTQPIHRSYRLSTTNAISHLISATYWAVPFLFGASLALCRYSPCQYLTRTASYCCYPINTSDAMRSTFALLSLRCLCFYSPHSWSSLAVAIPHSHHPNLPHDILFWLLIAFDSWNSLISSWHPSSSYRVSNRLICRDSANPL